MPFSMGEGALKLCNLFQTTTGEFPMAKKMFFNVKNLLYVRDNENSNSCVYVASRYEK